MKRVPAIALAAIVAAGATCRAAIAMPVFAEAYGYDCQMCHVQVPALNSFGRQVQRSMYATLDRQTLSAIVPVWVGESANGDTQSAFDPNRVQFGNLAVHDVGFIAPDVTTHVQQWLTQGDLPGGLDTAWISYDHIFGSNSHLVVGKMPPPGPSAFSQWMDLAPFAVPGTTVGEHALAVANNRWGVKGGWSNDRFTADAGVFGAGTDLNGATDFSNTHDKALQWHVAYAPSDHPVQAGFYGSHGSAPLIEGGIDRYAATGVYVQADPTTHVPGVLLLYQRGWDGNAGQAFGPAASSAGALELSWSPLRHYEALLSAREEVQNDGLGTVTHSGNVDLNLRVARFVHATIEEYAASNARPGTRYQVWWTTPLQRATPVRSALPAPPQGAAPASSLVTPGAGANAAGSAGATGGSAAVVHIKDSAYSPLTVTVKVGETVQFVNDDATPHTVSASDKSFDSGNINQNAAWSYVFSKAGTYSYICTFHANMKGSIIVGSIATKARSVAKLAGSAARSTAATRSGAAVVHIKGFAYSPRTLTVKVGQPVRFVNDDATPHTVTASDKSFDSGNMNQNAAWSHVFAKVGTYAYICTYHAKMNGIIVVR